MWASDGAGAAQQAYSMFGNHEGGFQGIQRSLGDQSVSMERGAPFGQGPAFQSTHGNVETFMPGWRYVFVLGGRVDWVGWGLSFMARLVQQR
eukprot:NODE_934_length_1674_cov_590.604308_g766_i0.p7 GENE.NODE_934_length_1674_cov_590.604308_g766_i0~~NODE_934_length_1674_cov_590.604308_g766_i0.p7  ORF type:complete len:92 (+),score=24.74 NODE_934_length_1674_cov_590.604308_g766_i0:901-1176(+)